MKHTSRIVGLLVALVALCSTVRGQSLYINGNSINIQTNSPLHCSPGSSVSAIASHFAPLFTTFNGSDAVFNSSNTAFAILSLSYDTTCSAQMSSVDPNWTGLLLCDPTPPSFLTTYSATVVNGTVGFNYVFNDSALAASGPAPGWVWYTQIVEVDSNGYLHAHDWVCQNQAYFQ